jgi:hypothetical protein
MVIDSSLHRATVAVPITDRRGGAPAARAVLVTTMLVARSMTELISDHIRKGGHDDCQQ